MKFNKLESNFWTDEKVRAWDTKTQFLALYILTNPHRHTEGLYRLPKHYIAGDLSISIEKVDKLLADLIKTDFIAYDDKNSIILIKKALKYSPTRNKNHQKAALKKLKELPKTYLFKEFLTLAEKYNKSFASYLKKELSEYFVEEDPCLTGDHDAINNGIIDGMDDAVGDSMGDSLELELALAQAPALEQALLKNRFSSEPEPEIIFVEKKFANEHNSEPQNALATETNLYSPKDQIDLKAQQLTEKLIDLILANNPRAKVPVKNSTDQHFQKWLKSIERLHRLGPLGAKAKENKGYSWQEIEELIEFSQQNDFWQTNILSPQKLRKKAITLENQLQRVKSENHSQAKMDMLAELYSEADAVDADE